MFQSTQFQESAEHLALCMPFSDCMRVMYTAIEAYVQRAYLIDVVDGHAGEGTLDKSLVDDVRMLTEIGSTLADLYAAMDD